MDIRSLILTVSFGVVATACSSDSVLDRRALLERQTWWDNRDFGWYEARIPFFESPNPDIDATYYYRWEVVTKHLTYGSPETGYTFTEFIDRPFWSGTYGGISCPLGHQHYEVRWLKDRRVVEDFARYWFETPGAQPRSYSNWYGDAMWATYLVMGDRRFLETVLPHMEAQYRGWTREHWDPDHRMFQWDGMHDGMETNINSRLTADTFAGAEGYRPTLNSYLFADARAIAQAAALLGDSGKARLYEERAAELKARVQDELWDPSRDFFFHQFANDEPHGIRAKSLTYETGPEAGSPHGRELLGYVPWQFNLPDPGHEAAWRFLMDTAYFAAPFGPTTVERNDPQFLISDVCCIWSGNEWPYATTQTLVAMANLLNNYEQSYVTRADYVSLLETYSLDQRMEDRPYIAEAADPVTGSWEGHNTFYHSEHYFHSGYVDLVITGLMGLRPRADDSLEVNPLIPDDWPYAALEGVDYHGYDVAILWDRDGQRYGKGRGLTVLVDGRLVANAPTLGRLVTPIDPPVVPASTGRPHNFAVNNGREYPVATASYSAPATPPFYAVDGSVWYHASPPNRWTTVGSANDEDWLAVDFGIERPVEAVVLYFIEEGDRITPPAEYAVDVREGDRWVEVTGERTPALPAARRANRVSLGTIRTSGLRIRLTHQAGRATGLSEMEVWGQGALPLEEPRMPSPNLAFGASATASYTYAGDRLEQLTDMQIWFTRYSRNRWSALESPNGQDWVAVELGAMHTVGVVDLYLYGDRGLAAPASYAVEVWDGSAWVPVGERSRFPEMPTVWAMNRVVFEPVETDRVRLLFDHDLPSFTGVTEIMIWEREP
jgi:hypothetical protein